MDVPSPPLWQNLLFEQPWPIAIVLVGVGLILRTVGRRRMIRALQWAALAAVLIAAGVVAMAYAVETGREAVRRLTLELVDATAPINTQTVSRLLADDVVVAGPRGESVLAGEAVHRRLEAIDETYDLEPHRVRSLQAYAAGREGEVGLALYTRVSATPALTTWRLVWRKGDDGKWRVAEVRWLSYQGQDPPVQWLGR